MQLFPILEIGWLNGWLPLAFFYGWFGIFLLSCSKPIVKKLYSVSGWTKREYLLSGLGKPFSLACIVLMIFTPIDPSTFAFYIGLIRYAIGFAFMFIALFEFKRMRVNEPVASGIYQYSRNPQWFGLVLIFTGTALMSANGLAILLFAGILILYHLRILGEERACLAAYGKAYQDYLNEVPRYF